MVESSNYRRFSVVSREKMSPIQWDEMTELTHSILSSNHVMIAIGNYLFIHGGINVPNSLKPINDFYRIDLKSFVIENLTNTESPYLSQHAGVIFSNRFIILIGGWNGHSRTCGIEIFDSQLLKWLKPPIVEGFPNGAGLSSHTANACLKSKSKFPDIIIIGREGSTRIQRRYGNAFRLTCNSDLTKFTYYEISLSIDSRSGHCTSLINSKLFIVGGRDDKVIDIHSIKNSISDKSCNVVSTIINRFKEFDLEVCPLAGKRKAGRRGSCLIPGHNGFIITGGSSFIETAHVANSAGFLYVISSTGENYYFLGSIYNSRADGSYVVTDDNEAIYHGGIDVNGKIRSEFLKLKLTVE